MMYKKAVVAGKFNPFHKGHEALIRHATDLAEKVYVILVANPTEEVPAVTRALSIYETLTTKNIEVRIVDDLYTDDSTEVSSEFWAKLTKVALGISPDVVVASEEYGRRWAKYLGASFEMFDQERLTFPISGTMCRANAFHTYRMMPPATRRYMIPRVVVLGAESTGTTTLAAALAETYGTAFVPEMGRLIEEADIRAGKGGDASWDDGKFWLTSRSQDAMEERYASEADRLLICDTDSLATSLWYKYYMKKDSRVSGEIHKELLQAGLAQAKKHVLYIVTVDDIPFIQDDHGSRTGEHLRRWMTDEFIALLSVYGLPFITVSGSVEDRLETAVAAIDSVVDRQAVPVLQ